MGRREPPEQKGGAPYLTTGEAAHRLGVSINAVKTWIREERLPALRTPGGHFRISETDLAAFRTFLAGSSKVTASVRPRILVVDDDEVVLASLRDTLAQLIPGAVVETATDGYEGLVRVGAFRPDVLVLDIRMPRLDGFEVCRRLKARRETASVRILAVTAYDEGDVRERILQCGADDFLGKPFPIEELRSRVEALLGRDSDR
jgi:excisionase family DNA binding protein